MWWVYALVVVALLAAAWAGARAWSRRRSTLVLDDRTLASRAAAAEARERRRHDRNRGTGPPDVTGF